MFNVEHNYLYCKVFLKQYRSEWVISWFKNNKRISSPKCRCTIFDINTENLYISDSDVSYIT